MDDYILQTNRLLLRYQRKRDIEFLIGLWMDPDMTKFTGGPREREFLLDEFNKVSENPQKEEYDLWTIELLDSHDLVGQAGFIPKIVNEKEYIEQNFYIQKEKWGNGYGKEIAYGLSRHVFSVKKLDSIISIIDPDNEQSKAVVKSIGMHFWQSEERSGKTKDIYQLRSQEI